MLLHCLRERLGVSAAVVAAAALVPTVVYAIWPHDPSVNVPICTATNDQNAPTVVSDGTGGAIVTWMDVRGPGWDIYAQRVSAAGVPLWTADGILLCNASNDQGNPVSASDGQGGAIIAWYDGRGASIDLYAQRVSGSGVPQWTANGVPLCIALYEQSWPTIVWNGSNGVVVAWQDFRNAVDFDIYVRGLLLDGTPVFPDNGLAVCTATGDQRYPVAAPDDMLGAIVAWQDLRSGTYDIYIQRVDGFGMLRWTADGVALCTASSVQQNPAIVSDGAGGAIITWEDYRGGASDIYAQRVNSTGVPQWTADGIAVCSATSYQYSPQIATDGTGGAIIAWQDARVAGGGGDIYAQRLDSAGVARWTTNGVALCTATREQSLVRVLADGTGGAIVAWQDLRSGTFYDIYAQKVNTAGVPQWAADGVALGTAAGEQSWPVQSRSSLVPDGLGGAIAVWRDYRSGTNFDIYAQRVDPSGGLTGVDTPPVLTTTFRAQSVPNPFNPRTTIRFDLPEAGVVRLSIYDIGGRLLRILVDSQYPVGSHEAVWDGRDSAGRSLASGSYFARLQVGGKLQTVRMSLVR